MTPDSDIGLGVSSHVQTKDRFLFPAGDVVAADSITACFSTLKETLRKQKR